MSADCGERSASVVALINGVDRTVGTASLDASGNAVLTFPAALGMTRLTPLFDTGAGLGAWDVTVVKGPTGVRVWPEVHGTGSARSLYLYASVTPAAARAVVLQRRIGGVWKSVTTGRTTARGGVRFLIATLLTKHGLYEWRVAAPATASNLSATSSSFTVLQ